MEQKKPWYKLRGVEYSTDLNFFTKHQLFSVQNSSDRYRRYCSRLEKFEFAAKQIWDWQGNEVDVNDSAVCEEIHNKLLNGGYGQGELVD